LSAIRQPMNWPICLMASWAAYSRPSSVLNMAGFTQADCPKMVKPLVSVIAQMVVRKFHNLNVVSSILTHRFALKSCRLILRLSISYRGHVSCPCNSDVLLRMQHVKRFPRNSEVLRRNSTCLAVPRISTNPTFPCIPQYSEELRIPYIFLGFELSTLPASRDPTWAKGGVAPGTNGSC
jgi:hypothetical protein